MATGARTAGGAKRFYIWHGSGATFSIHLSLDVVERMTRELFHAAMEYPPRDISGVLLGRSLQGPHPASVVEDFVYTAGERRNEGSSLVEDDPVAHMIWRLLKGTENGRHIVGFFRSQRDDRLAPNDLDLTNASRLFGQPDNVLLLIRLLQSGGSEATFFCWEGVETQDHGSSAPFPFDAAQLPAASLSGWSDPGPGLFEHACLPQAITTHVAIEPSLWLRLLPTFALFGLVTAGAQMVWPSRPAEATQTAEMTKGDASSLGLRVAVLPRQLDIRWNQHSTQILAAENAVVEITESDVTEKIPIDRQELRDGYVAYSPKTNDVYIRFEVSGPDGNITTESVRVVAIP